MGTYIKTWLGAAVIVIIALTAGVIGWMFIKKIQKPAQQNVVTQQVQKLNQQELNNNDSILTASPEGKFCEERYGKISEENKENGEQLKYCKFPNGTRCIFKKDNPYKGWTCKNSDPIDYDKVLIPFENILTDNYPSVTYKSEFYKYEFKYPSYFRPIFDLMPIQSSSEGRGHRIILLETNTFLNSEYINAESKITLDVNVYDLNQYNFNNPSDLFKVQYPAMFNVAVDDKFVYYDNKSRIWYRNEMSCLKNNNCFSEAYSFEEFAKKSPFKTLNQEPVFLFVSDSFNEDRYNYVIINSESGLLIEYQILYNNSIDIDYKNKKPSQFYVDEENKAKNNIRNNNEKIKNLFIEIIKTTNFNG